jgi:hypothetical protein
MLIKGWIGGEGRRLKVEREAGALKLLKGININSSKVLLSDL